MSRWSDAPSAAAGVHYLQIASGFSDYTLETSYPDGYFPTPAFPKKVSVQCSGYCS